MDLEHAGTPEYQLGLPLGTVLVYLSSHAAQIIAGVWASAAPVAASLVPQLPARRCGLVLSSWP
ncbi:hypothetical protein [Pseudonocardia sp. N23]|uniref:hypothetical protein n=1 Tax=Pseudonocardia sp. N23 TaxID=1987376 RepID=UPI000C02F397|nr:hypothetical protein [Pseudonocardia sp. N23]GAY09625.1 hypothetical protein TOK_3892 [Pseudonocardia sp. N23]